MTRAQLELPLACQRWNKGREFYRPAGEPIRKNEFGIEIVRDGEAKAFIARHHYAKSAPPQILSVGLYRTTGAHGSRLVGVARFSVPMNQFAVPKHTGQDAANGCELGRLVLTDEVAANGESFFVARAMEVLRQEKPHIRAVVSYSDPLPRSRADGTVFKRGHIGTCYQALNARHVGRGKRRTLLLTSDGDVISERTLSKLRNNERGAEYAYRTLLEAGCPERIRGEDSRVYIERAIREAGFRKVRHPGNLVYCWALGRPKERRQRWKDMPSALPYPKLDGVA